MILETENIIKMKKNFSINFLIFTSLFYDEKILGKNNLQITNSIN